MDEIKTELNRIAEAAGGLLKPEDVIANAENTASPLHRYFQWNNAAAAHAHRLAQARQLIRSVVIEVNTAAPVAVRAFVSLPADRRGGVGYRPIGEVIDSEFLCRQLVSEMEAKVTYWRSQLAALGQAIDVEPLEKMAEALKSRRAAYTQAEAAA